MHNKAVEKLIQGLTILIVDANAFMRRQTRIMLTNLGAKSVIEANDGLAALELIRTRDPDVMFMDWDMPVLDGLEVMRIVRSPGVFPRPNLPIIMLTGRAQRSAVTEALRTGVNEYPGQADLAQGAARPAGLDRRQAAADDEGGRILRAGAARGAHARRAGAGGRHVLRPVLKSWRARDDSNVRPLPSEGNALSS